MPMALGASLLFPNLLGANELGAREPLEPAEWECMWFGVGAAVHGRWRGELGDAFTGRRYCWSERGEGMKEAENTDGESRRPGGRRGELEVVCVS
jgi:hypothetical protein